MQTYVLQRRDTPVAAGVQEQAAAGAPHAVAVVCTNVSGAPHVAGLEPQLDMPVFDNVSAALWKALDVVRAPVTVTGWDRLLATGTARARLQQAMAGLLAATGADRTTVRLDLPTMGLHVDLTAAEAVAPDVRSIRWDGSLDQRRLNTVMWLEEHRKPLVQPHFRDAPRPSDALVEVYGVRAQVLGPILRGEAMTGWISGAQPAGARVDREGPGGPWRRRPGGCTRCSTGAATTGSGSSPWRRRRRTSGGVSRSANGKPTERQQIPLTHQRQRRPPAARAAPQCGAVGCAESSPSPRYRRRV
jgi:hypothetical protein